MNDQQILEQIHQLVAEEQELRGQHAHSALDGDAKGRLNQLEIALDQCWDLLRQRRAHREFGQSPDEAQARDPTTVERYQQ